MQVDWSPKESVQQLLVLLRERDLSALDLLAAATDNVCEVAYTQALEGHIIELATLLLVATDKVFAPMYNWSATKMRSVYVAVLEEAMKMFEMEMRAQSNGNRARYEQNMVQVYQKRRRLYLLESELMQMFGATLPVACQSRKELPLLLHALQIGDEPVSKLLLQAGADTSLADGYGNSVLHLSLRTASISQNLRLIRLLLKHGAKVSQQNWLGLTPIHVAAEKGNYQALQILLLQDPECVDLASKTKDTPLFFAARNGFLDCTKLLLQYGANSQAINLRRQKPIDVASSQDIRFILNPVNQGFSKHSIASNEDTNHEMSSFVDKELNTELREPAVSNRANVKSEICHYYKFPGGCSRGIKCNFAHGESELRLENITRSPPQQVVNDRKIFVGGLPLSVDSDYLKEFFKATFGPVKEATVITTKSGSQSQSRGFGFVIFMQEETAARALETRFVTVFNKKVEIKTCEPVSLSMMEVPLLEKKNLPPWALKFKKWFPKFLKRSMKRAENKEGYPLSSLKADFRATCGMELDHMSVGLFKLSDFIRAFPEICKIWVIPAPNGLATHMVLLPSKSNITHGINYHEVGNNESSNTESEDNEKINIGNSGFREESLPCNPWRGKGAMGAEHQPFFSLFDKQWDHYYPEMIQKLSFGNQFAKECMASNSRDFNTICQLQKSCRGALATVSCLPCGHKIACFSCIQPSWYLGPKSCSICGCVVERLNFLKA